MYVHMFVCVMMILLLLLLLLSSCVQFEHPYVHIRRVKEFRFGEIIPPGSRGRGGSGGQGGRSNGDNELAVSYAYIVSAQ